MSNVWRRPGYACLCRGRAAFRGERSHAAATRSVALQRPGACRASGRRGAVLWRRFVRSSTRLSARYWSAATRPRPVISGRRCTICCTVRRHASTTGVRAPCWLLSRPLTWRYGTLRRRPPACRCAGCSEGRRSMCRRTSRRGSTRMNSPWKRSPRRPQRPCGREVSMR